MTEQIKEKLDAEIESQLGILSDYEFGTEEYKNGVECVAKLIDKRNEMEKIDLETKKQESSIESEKENKQENRKNQIITHAISISAIVIPVFVTIWGTCKTLKFEETGTVTTIMGRGFINKLIPKK